MEEQGGIVKREPINSARCEVLETNLRPSRTSSYGERTNLSKTEPEGARIQNIGLRPISNSCQVANFWGHGGWIRFLPIPIALWLIQFLVQWLWLSNGTFWISVIRASALTGLLLICAALLTSIVFKFRPRLAVHWRVRRWLGVSGFLWILVHVVTALLVVYHAKLSVLIRPLNPIQNPIVFGTIAFVIFASMAITSNDRAMRKLTPPRWKLLHRFVYVAMIAATAHFLLMESRAAYRTIPVLIVFVVIALTILGQVFWLFKISSQHQFRSRGFFIGLGILILAVVVGIFVANEL